MYEIQSGLHQTAKKNQTYEWNSARIFEQKKKYLKHVNCLSEATPSHPHIYYAFDLFDWIVEFGRNGLKTRENTKKKKPTGKVSWCVTFEF